MRRNRPNLYTVETLSDRPILIAEDSAEDFELTERALRAAGVEASIRWCRSGDETLDYLRRQGRFASHEESPSPLLVLLDLKLPGTDGREVLESVKSDPELRTIPVVVLSTSTSERDVHDCYALGANSYVTKSLSLTRFAQSMRRVVDYWLGTVALPRPL